MSSLGNIHILHKNAAAKSDYLDAFFAPFERILSETVAGNNFGSSRISVKKFPVHYGLGRTTTDISVKSL